MILLLDFGIKTIFVLQDLDQGILTSSRLRQSLFQGDLLVIVFLDLKHFVKPPDRKNFHHVLVAIGSPYPIVQ